MVSGRCGRASCRRSLMRTAAKSTAPPARSSWRARGSSAGRSIRSTRPPAMTPATAAATHLWLLDPDLDQVPGRPVDAPLSSTPAMLPAGVADLHQSFSITPAGQREGLEWVLVEPRAAEADFRSALFGFAHRELKRMI